MVESSSKASHCVTKYNNINNNINNNKKIQTSYHIIIITIKIITAMYRLPDALYMLNRNSSSRI